MPQVCGTHFGTPEGEHHEGGGIFPIGQTLKGKSSGCSEARRGDGGHGLAYLELTEVSGSL